MVRQHQRRHRQRLVAAALVGALLPWGCGGTTTPTPAALSAPPGQDAFVALTPEPAASGDTGVDVCRSIANVEERLAALRGVELRLPNRVALDIELAKLQSAFGELRQADLGTLEDELRLPLRRLGYRLVDVELAVEDFRTNPRPQRAVPHIENETQHLADELSAFAILARC